MKAPHRFALASLLVAETFCCNAADTPVGCDRDSIDTHVREQIQLYGPRSAKREYFAFVYDYQGVIASAVVQGSKCDGEYSCAVHTAPAAQQIPKGARVLGEWHTHPHGGSRNLSAEDVRGAYNNHHIRCYLAYYAKPNGEILAWDSAQATVPSAMRSRVLIGRYSGENAERAVRRNARSHTP